MAGQWVVGADAGGTQVKYVITPAGGESVAQGQIPTNPHDPQETFARLAQAVADQWPETTDHLTAVGLACAGIVSPRTGALGRSPNLPGWEGMDLAAGIGEAFGGLPTVVANDVNAALYGEYRLGAGRGCSDLVMVALGTGVGGGVILDGRIVTGVHDGAGEIGHTVLSMSGPRCTCGNRGCLEAYAGSVAILRQARELAADPAANSALRELVTREGENLSPAALARLAATGESTTTSLFTEVGRRLGQAVANIINLVDPDRIIIGGGVAQAGELILAPCREVVQHSVLAAEARQTPIVLAALGPFAAALGAAVLAPERGEAS